MVPVVMDPTSKGSQFKASGEDEDALFQALLHRIPGAADKHHLLERCDAALRLVFTQPGDAPHQAELSSKIARIVATVPDDGPARPEALQAAAEACVTLLKTAKQATSGPAIGHAPPAADTIAGYEARAKARRAHRPPPPPKRSWLPVLVLLAVIGGGLAITLFVWSDTRSTEKSERPLVAQMEAAAKGSAPATNIFGGALSVSQQGGHPVVTVAGVPPGECVSAGWDLVRKGLLTVNGATPNRVSAAILNELCHQEDSATLVWIPKGN